MVGIFPVFSKYFPFLLIAIENAVEDYTNM
jgi:hypothetical protein